MLNPCDPWGFHGTSMTYVKPRQAYSLVAAWDRDNLLKPRPSGA